MKFKVISGFQTGVDRAAIDAALTVGFETGGFVPCCRIAEDGAVPERYTTAVEISSVDYAKRTKMNIDAADATLILTRYGKKGRGTVLTENYAKKQRKPVVVVDLAMAENEVIDHIVNFITAVRPRTLNVAGSRESKSPGIYEAAMTVLCAVFVRVGRSMSLIGQ